MYKLNHLILIDQYVVGDTHGENKTLVYHIFHISSQYDELKTTKADSVRFLAITIYTHI